MDSPSVCSWSTLASFTVRCPTSTTAETCDPLFSSGISPASGSNLHHRSTHSSVIWAHSACSVRLIEDVGAAKTSVDLKSTPASSAGDSPSPVHRENDSNQRRFSPLEYNVTARPVYVSNIRGLGGVTERNERRRRQRFLPDYCHRLMKKGVFGRLGAEALQDARTKLEQAFENGLPMDQTGIVGLRSCFWVDDWPTTTVSASDNVTATPSASPPPTPHKAITKTLRRAKSSPSSPRKKSKTRACAPIARRAASAEGHLASATLAAKAPRAEVTATMRVLLEDIFVGSQFLMTRRVEDPVALAKLENDPTVLGAQERLRRTPSLAPGYTDLMDDLEHWRAERDRKEMAVLGPQQHSFGPRIVHDSAGCWYWAYPVVQDGRRLTGPSTSPYATSPSSTSVSSARNSAPTSSSASSGSQPSSSFDGVMMATRSPIGRAHRSLINARGASSSDVTRVVQWRQDEDGEHIATSGSSSSISSAHSAAAIAYGLYDKYASTSAKYPASRPSPPTRLECLTNRRVPVERRSVDLSRAFFGVAPLLPYRHQNAGREDGEAEKDRGSCAQSPSLLVRERTGNEAVQNGGGHPAREWLKAIQAMDHRGWLHWLMLKTGWSW